MKLQNLTGAAIALVFIGIFALSILYSLYVGIAVDYVFSTFISDISYRTAVGISLLAGLLFTVHMAFGNDDADSARVKIGLNILTPLYAILIAYLVDLVLRIFA